MRIKSYTEALRLARCAGEDAAKRRMRKAGRKAMSQSDYDYAVDVMETILTDLGFDVRGWVVMAGVPRNEPPEAKAVRKPRRQSKGVPVQLNFAFA